MESSALKLVSLLKWIIGLPPLLLWRPHVSGLLPMFSAGEKDFKLPGAVRLTSHISRFALLEKDTPRYTALKEVHIYTLIQPVSL